MKISLNWLKEFVDIPWSVEETAEKITLLGFPVEGITQTGLTIKNIVAAEILEVEKHPNADRLQIAKVNDGKGERTIVCGAPNIAPGQVVPLALPGAKLAPDFEIKQSKIRGVESAGMLCSARELKISDDHSGIYQLPKDSKLGTQVKDLLGEADVIFDIDVTPNRPDTLNHVGIARELSALTSKPIKLPKNKWKKSFSGPPCKITIKDPKLCHRYIGKIFTGIKVGPSPSWMAQRLNACGIRSINNIVDITNYVLLEWGHPLHAFDLYKLDGKQIVVRRAKDKEKIAALDEKIYELSKDDLVIADAKYPVAIAGIMGGQDSGVVNSTRDILLESAAFDRVTVRKTSRRLNLKSESSYRFERGTDVETAEQASLRAAQLIMELSGGKPGQAQDAFPTKPKKVSVSLRHRRLVQALGMDVAKPKTEKILKNLGFKPTKNTAGWKCTPPAYRKDIFEEADLIEEVTRIVGYDSVPETLPALNPGQIPDNQVPLDVRDLRDFLKGQGLNETLSSTFTEKELVGDLGFHDKNWVELINPISQEETILRPAVAVNLLKAIKRNIHFQRNEVRLFEIGKTYGKKPSGHPFETQVVSLGLYGNRSTPHWGHKDQNLDYFDLSGVIEGASEIDSFGLSIKAGGQKSFLHPSQQFEIFRKGKVVGWGGLVYPELANKLDFKLPCLIAEWSLEQKKVSFDKLQPLPRFPFVERDVAIVVDKSKSWSDIEKIVRKADRDLLETVVPFDVFSGGSMDASKKSIAFRIRLQSLERTLSDAEINSVVEKIKNGLKQEAGAELR